MDGSPAIQTTAVDIVDLLGKVEHRELLRRAYHEVYLPAFPVAEERESLAEWEALLWEGDRGPPAPKLHVLVARAGRELVHGLVAGEYYRESNTGLISYIAVGESSRGQGLGKCLIEAIVETLEADARKAGRGRLDGAFAEVHDPSRAPQEDSIDPVSRLRFMDRCGARVVPVSYVQPQLRPGARRVDNLLLLAFPVGGRLSYTLPSKTVLGFLRELYRALDVSDPERDGDFKRMADELRGKATELGKLHFRSETQELSIHDYAMAVHVVLDPSPDEPRRLPPRSAHLDSFEQDMLAYAFRGAPPLRTVLVPTPEDLAEVEMLIPPVICYRAEGRYVVLTCAGGRMPRRRRLRVTAARTDFLRSGLSVLHVILTPCADSDVTDLSEFDIVKVIKIWEGGEGLPGPGDRQDWLRFQARTGPHLAFIELAERLLAGRQVRRVKGSPSETSSYRVGTIQVLTATTVDHEESMTADLIGAMVRLRDDPAAFREVHARNDVEWRRLRALGGIVQGLLDFEEIDESELRDVFSECQGDARNQLAVHKGTLLHVAPGDRVADSTRDYLGVNPYLMVSHGIVIHNEVLLREAALLTEGLSHSDPRRLLQTRSPVRVLREKRAQISRALDDQVPNVMHYDQERLIYEHGHRARRLTDLDEKVRGELDRSAIIVEKELSDRATLSGALIGIVVTLITAVSFLPKWSIPLLVVVSGVLYWLAWRAHFRQSG